MIPFMNRLRRSLFLALAAGALFGSIGRAENGAPARTVNITYTFDRRGDAEIEISFQHDAQHWAAWKERYGDHPDLLLRDTRYSMASAVLDDFRFSKDDVQRTAVSKIKARALARYRGNGEFIIDVPKEMKLASGSGSEWVFTTSSSMDGELVAQTLKGILPPKATNAHFTQGGDYNELIYDVDVVTHRPRRWLALGLLLIVAGVGVFAAAQIFRQKNSGSVIVTPPPTPPGPPPLSHPPGV